MTEPVIAELASQLKETVKIVKINVDQNPASMSEYNITGVPTFILFRNGREVSRRIGAQSKGQLLNLLKDAKIKV